MAHVAGLVLDAGAFIAIERRSPFVTKLLGNLVSSNIRLVTSGAVIAQVWRGGSGSQVPVAMLIRQVEVIALDCNEAKIVGTLLGASRTKDPADGHIVLIAQERRWPVLSSDESDLKAIDPRVDVIGV
jgi:hypothetical protein